jgi:RsiW-degrading membrane proteinase PrsW (M82 family)
MSPFVSIGFSFIENMRYYYYDMTIAQMLGRTLFSLPLHIFVGLTAFWILLSIRSRIFGIIIGLCMAIGIHMFYNWSLAYSPLITLPIMIV